MQIQLDEYVQSANTLFHFMKEPEYLNDILLKKAIVPRYCIENIDYLDLTGDELSFNEIAVLQKCFCDISLHKLSSSFKIECIGNNFNSLSKDQQKKLNKKSTHFEFYGSFAISFSKAWGESNNLQPVQYLNQDANSTINFRKLLKQLINTDTIPSEYADDILSRLTLMKPLRGIMKRTVQDENTKEDLTVEFIKNFHDEKEWRYIPPKKYLSDLDINEIIANPNIMDKINLISTNYIEERYEPIWMKYQYDDIQYIIVPDSIARYQMINFINYDIPKENFSLEKSDELLERALLISKILVLDEIKKDW